MNRRPPRARWAALARWTARARRAVGPLLDVALVHGLLGWLYIAVWAACRPDSLSGPLSSWLPLRRDTFGALCFALSALAHLSRGLRPAAPPWWRPSGAHRDRVEALLRTLTGYPLLAWAYLCVNSLTHPWTIDRQLTHFATVPTEGTTAAGCFALSAVALLLLRLRAARPPEESGHARIGQARTDQADPG
ncbi:hypothetical protein [Kitasatospora sp. NBC_01266]|uniref:hypothetical protein n=1 Tax=Kitasatospora sp. NBC_01266 TaxID=2903572 RepID=UPI002E3228A0|nr:hypothetical protein [Kitasatospora sp. NBC_01266]